MWHLAACKISVCLLFLNWIKNEMIFYQISELMLATLIQRYDKKSFYFKKEGLTEKLTVSGATFYDCINTLYSISYLLNLSWIINCLFSKNMEPLRKYENTSMPLSPPPPPPLHPTFCRNCRPFPPPYHSTVDKNKRPTGHDSFTWVT